METVSEQVFERVEVASDGKRYVECTFDNCSITSNGNSECQFERCKFKDCEWIFAGAIERTMVFKG
jgi:hypothetical protein